MVRATFSDKSYMAPNKVKKMDGLTMLYLAKMQCEPVRYPDKEPIIFSHN